MADSRRLGSTPIFDIEQILREAQQRWLRSAEICEILRNYHKFHIAPEPPNKPSNGSLFLFDRKVLRYFRKDGHNWRKKRDGKTVKEAHEKLKAGSVDVLHCYYAHGEDNESFQRRSYWMLEEELMHIVLVHYREVKGNKANHSQQREDWESLRILNPDSPACSNSSVNLCQMPPQVPDYGSPNNTHQSEYEDTDLDNYQSSSRHYSFPEMQQHGPWMNVPLANAGSPALIQHDQCNYQRLQASIFDLDPFTVAQENVIEDMNVSAASLTRTDMTSWHQILESFPTGISTPFDLSVASTWSVTAEDNPDQNSVLIQDILTSDISSHKEYGTALSCNVVPQVSDNEATSLVTASDTVENGHATKENINQLSDLSNKESAGLKKYDSFSRWMSKEFGAVDDSQISSNSGIYWSSFESENVVTDSNLLNHEHSDIYLISPSLSQDQLYSIIDFSPNWSYTYLVTKVIVMGRFLMIEEDLKMYNWSCMFGEYEVPARILENGTLCCLAPPHKPGKVPFYLTCSDRMACSEIREFEYKLDPSQNVRTQESSYSALQSRFENLLSLDSVDYSNFYCGHLNEKSHVDCTVCPLIMEDDDETNDLINLNPDEDLLDSATKYGVLEKQLKQNLFVWLLHKTGKNDGKGLNVLDKDGLGVLHLAAALGYDWAIKPIAAGVNINFRDAHGWTALHWAAFCGRETTVVTLIELDASPGALTDPTPEFPTGRTPADLASQNGHKGIAGFLAEFSLSIHLRTLTLKDSENHNLSQSYGLISFENISDKINANLSQREIQSSLTAVRNAAEAAARIFQVFRVQSFNRKRVMEHSVEKYKMSDDGALSLIALNPYKSGNHNIPVHAAAIKI